MRPPVISFTDAVIHPDLEPTLAQLRLEEQRAADKRASAVAQELAALGPDAPNRHANALRSAQDRLATSIAVYQRHIDDARKTNYPGSQADIVELSHEITLCRATQSALHAAQSSPSPMT